LALPAIAVLEGCLFFGRLVSLLSDKIASSSRQVPTTCHTSPVLDSLSAFVACRAATNNMTTKNQTNKHFIRFMPKSAAESKPYVCYLLHASEATKGPRTYVGITNNLTRRLRQHNREISGGSKYTGAICEG
jgi:hypothetical protein